MLLRSAGLLPQLTSKRNLSFTWPDLPRFPEMSDNWIFFFFFFFKDLLLTLFPGFFFTIYFIFYFWMCWVFVAACGLSLVVASGRCSLVAEHGL